MAFESKKKADPEALPKTPTQLSYNQAHCAQEIDEILKKYGMTLATESTIVIRPVSDGE